MAVSLPPWVPHFTSPLWTHASAQRGGAGQGRLPGLWLASGPQGGGDAPSFRCGAVAAGAPAGIPGMRLRRSGRVKPAGPLRTRIPLIPAA